MQDTLNRGVTRVFHARSSKRKSAQRESRRGRQWPAFVVSTVAAILLFQQGGRALPQVTDALRYFNTFFITGDVVSGGVGLWNTGAGTINVGAVPAGSEALGAFLYWQVVTSANPTLVDVNAGATFNGSPLNVPLGTQLQPTPRGVEVGTQACLLNGGTSRRVHSFRADVLPFLDTDPATGLRVINKVGGYPVAFSGGGSVLGASLVVLYRSPDPAAKLNAIVIYDGTFVKQQSATLRQRIEGFYDPASVPGQITYIAGSAQGNLGDTLTGPFAAVNNLFSGSSGNAWDTVVRTTASLAGATSFDTVISPQYSGFLNVLNDCIAMSAMIYRTEVNDGDGDGLLNAWETSGGTLLDPKGNPLPHFAAMGALVDVKDAFIEIAAMQAPPETTYGSAEAPITSTLPSVTDHKGHLHIPPPAVLKTWADPFAAKGIRVHFDVGNPAAYKSLLAYPTQLPSLSPYNSAVADDYIIGAGGLSGSDASQARGGEIVQETACTPSAGPPVVDCQFPDFPGTLVWKTGFEQYKEQLFDGNRKDSFRFAFYAHAKASPKSTLPCLGAEGAAAGLDPLTGECADGAPNPAIHVPAGVSGSGELNGGDFLVTLGLWDNSNFVGTDDGIAFTSMHEFGHTLGLGHGGNSGLNCKPNYVSLMNYSFQLGGVIDVAGNARAAFSEGLFATIDELNATDGYTIPGLLRTSWYAPQPAGNTQQPLKRFCNGLKFDPLAPPPATIRIDSDVDKATSMNKPIDWNNDGDLTDAGSQDVNFDGEPDGVTVPGEPSTTLTTYDDWANIRLNQVGSRRNFAGISIGPLGVKLLSDGSKLLADGSVLLADGSRLLADGSKLLADGSKLLADGAKFLADGSVLLADGSVLLADGVRLLSDGSRLLADGTKLLADGTRLLADGARLLADGSVLLADGSVLLADGTVFLADGSVLLADGVRFLSDGSMLLADGSPLLTSGIALAWHFAETTPQAAAESGTIGGPTSLTACVIGGTGVSACGPGAPAGPLHRVFLTWKAPLGNVDHYVLYRAEGDTIGPVTETTIVPGTDTSVVDGIELPSSVAFPAGTFTYVIEAVLADEDETVTPRSNEATITSENITPVATAQSVTVWEDWLSDAITLAGTDVDSSGVGPYSVQNPSTQGGTVTATLPTVKYKSALNFNGADSFTFTVRETTTWSDRNQASNPAAVSLTVTPVNDKPNFTKGANQTVAQPAGAQTVAGWATGFDAGPADEDLSQSVLQYIVSNNNTALFAAAGQPAIAPNGTLTYTPKVGGATGVATVTVQVRDNGGTSEGHGAVDTSDPQVFTITITSPATTITFKRTDIWVSTSSSSRTYDLKAQILKNGVPVLEKVVSNCTLGFGTTFNKAIYKEIGDFANTAVGFAASDTLSVRVSIRVSSSSPGGNGASGAIRLWYNIKTPPGNTSHVHATRAGIDVKYYLMPAFQLQKNGVVAGPTQSIDAVVGKNTFTVLGTWSKVGP